MADQETSRSGPAELPFLMRRENIVRYEDGAVLIFNRRDYPRKKEFVRCADVEAVAQAIEGMVTQGAGPAYAAGYALALAAREVAGRPPGQVDAHLQAAAERLIATRPTNTNLPRVLRAALRAADESPNEGDAKERALLHFVEAHRDAMYMRADKMGRFGADLIADGDGVLTNCLAESAFMYVIYHALQDGKAIRVYTPETRPYLQGARLTADCVRELGAPAIVITDNMPAAVMAQGKIQKYFTAADLVTLDGHVVNKIGTFGIAIAAAYHGIPFFALSHRPDVNRPDRASIVVEERDPEEVLHCLGVRTAAPGVGAYYPAFDITPPHLVAGVITEYGVLSPYDLARHFG
ncbi:MAG: s-methyl-5-thioribose-1-phosphate isomerase [Anaerolineae bacterium]|nr:s-methyl-5-thioribose-1-phosphate isomerase [Anaerolineae bacterium]